MRPGGQKPTSDLLSGLAKAYDLMKYDVALLAQSESDAASDFDVLFDKTRKTAKAEPFTKVTTAAGDKIGFIRFPSLNQGEDIPSNDLINQVSRLVKKHRKEVKLIIALSDWGWNGEREYLAQAPDHMPDLIFGSGRGSGVNGRIEADGRCVWVRPYDKGRTVNEVQVFSWPDHSKPVVWKEPDNVKSLSVGLGDQYHDDPDVSAILH